MGTDTSYGMEQLGLLWTDAKFVMDDYGRFMPALNRFPSSAGGKGFKPIADYIHGKGLKFGIHAMHGVPVLAVRNDAPVYGSSLD